MLNITLVKLTSSDFKYQYLNFISYERRNRIMKIKSVIDKKRSLISELLMRKSANEILGLPAGKIKFSYNPYGKPYIDNIRRYKFNVSHSGDYVTILTGKKSLGIDIEQVKDIDMSISRRFFTEEENCYIFSQKSKDMQVKAFYKVWTLKESYIKALGKGLNIPLNSFSFEIKDTIKLSSPPNSKFSFKTSYVDNHTLSISYLEKKLRWFMRLWMKMIYTKI